MAPALLPVLASSRRTLWHRQECVQFHDILYKMFHDILYTPARAWAVGIEKGPEGGERMDWGSVDGKSRFLTSFGMTILPLYL